MTAIAPPIPIPMPVLVRAERRERMFPPVRMLHVITRLVRGGADENTLYTVRGLDKSRYLVDLVVGRDSELEHLDLPDNVRILPLDELVRDPNPWLDTVALLRLASIMRRGGYQIVHTHTAKAGFLGRLAAALVGTPIIVHTVHGVTFHEHLSRAQRFFYLLLERVAARFTDQFVTVGEDVKDIYLRAGIGKAAAYETIYSGMPLEEYFAAADMSGTERTLVRSDLGYGPEHQVVAMAARLEDRKGHTYLLQAIAQLAPRYPGLRVLLLGEGLKRGAIVEEAVRLGISDRVQLAGHRTDLAPILAAVDVAVLTSLWEGLPRVLVQAAAAGRPILTFDVEGAWEVVREGKTGFIVPSKDIASFVERLDTLLSNREGADAMGAAGRERIGGEWTVETMVSRLDRMYRRLALADAA
jgi:glycosyltransferase involved in cell wall biosynthesis